MSGIKCRAGGCLWEAAGGSSFVIKAFKRHLLNDHEKTKRMTGGRSHEKAKS